MLQSKTRFSFPLTVLAITSAALMIAGSALAHDPDFTSEFDRERCTFRTTGGNAYYPLWPGYVLLLEGEEEDDEGELVEVSQRLSVLDETERVNGILTRVVEEFETEDGELVEISRNFIAVCRETGDVWYFGEDVEDFEDGEVIGTEGSFRDGQNGARAGIIMPGSPLIGARFFEEQAPGVALDRGEVLEIDAMTTVPTGAYQDVLVVQESSAMEPGVIGDEKRYAPGVGILIDGPLELTSITPPPCQPDETTHCLSNGRFEIEVEWQDFAGNSGDGNAILASDDSGEFWFFSAGNTELLVKVIDACDSEFNSFWVFAAGLTNVEVSLTVTDTQTQATTSYSNPLGTDFQPVLDTSAFSTCP